MTVGTVARKVTRCSVTSRRNSWASNRGIRTRWWPISRPAAAKVEPGAVAHRHRHQLDVAFLRAKVRLRTLAGIRLSPPASISLGRPVLPPEAIAFHTGETASGSGASDSPGSGVKPLGTLGDLPRGSALPTTSARGRNSRSPSNSASGSRADNGCGTAPSFQHAMVACRNSIELGSTMVT